MRLYLIGYSYGGKSTLGKQLAQRMGFDFFDTDKAIEHKYKLTIPLFFQHYGEQAFRIIEAQILQSTAQMDNVVVSTGGGTACNDGNIRFILEHGTALYLQMSLDDILFRMAQSRKNRPLLMGKEPAEQKALIERQLKERIPFYSQAHITVPALNATADILLQQIQLFTEKN